MTIDYFIKLVEQYNILQDYHADYLEHNMLML